MRQIVCTNLKLEYNKRQITGAIDMEIESGDYVAIIGENGAGKSTFIRELLGLRSESTGILMFNDLKKNDIGYLPQQTDIQKDFPASVFEVVSSGLQGSKGAFPFLHREDKLKIVKALNTVDMLRYKQHSYRKLSGGQQQRVLLARALCAGNKLLVLDEPVAGLDQSSQTAMYNTIRRVNRRGVTILMVTHDVLTAQEEASHILRIGKTCSFTKTNQVMEVKD